MEMTVTKVFYRNWTAHNEMADGVIGCGKLLRFNGHNAVLEVTEDERNSILQDAEMLTDLDMCFGDRRLHNAAIRTKALNAGR